MNNSSLRWGLLSTARINRALIPPLRASPRNQLTAVASRSQSSAEAYAAEWKIERVFSSYEAMLADPDLDAVSVVTMWDQHAAPAIAARALWSGASAAAIAARTSAASP